MEDRNKTIKSLIEVLLDPNGDISDQDDAAGYLGQYDDDLALEALIFAAKNPNTDEWIVLQTCGESIARIWDLTNSFNLDAYLSMRTSAQVGAYDYIVGQRPDWIGKFKIPAPS